MKTVSNKLDQRRDHVPGRTDRVARPGRSRRGVGHGVRRLCAAIPALRVEHRQPGRRRPGKRRRVRRARGTPAERAGPRPVAAGAGERRDPRWPGAPLRRHAGLPELPPGGRVPPGGGRGGPGPPTPPTTTPAAAPPRAPAPPPADGRAIAGAGLVLVNGVGYDPWAGKLVDANPAGGRTVLDVGELVGVKAGGNPH